MRTIPLAEVLQMGDGEPVPRTRGILKAIFIRFDDRNENGPWSIQNVILSDDGAEVKCVIKDRPAINPEWQGKTLFLISREESDGKSLGLTVAQGSYANRAAKVLLVTPEATIMPSAPIEYPDPGPTPEDDRNWPTSNRNRKPTNKNK